MKIFQHLSIKNKLVVLVLMVSLLAIVLGFALVVYYDIKTFRSDMEDTTNTIAKFVADACGPVMEFQQVDELTEELAKLRGVPIVENAYVYNQDMELIEYNYIKPGEEFTPLSSLPKKQGESTIFDGDYLHVYKKINSGGKSGDDEQVGMLYLRASTHILDKKINEYLKTMGFGLIGLIILTYILAARFQRMISRPILKLADVTEHITKDADYGVRVEKEGDDEIGTLYTGFNNMLEQIQLREEQRDAAEAEQRRLNVELEEKNKELEQVVYVTSHDLRSPLVNIQGFSKELGFSLEELSTLVNSEKLPEDVKEKFSLILEEDIPDSLKYILSSTARMDSLLSGLLKLSRVKRTSTTFKNIDMTELINEISNAFEFQLKEGGVEFKIGDIPSCFGNDDQITQMFSNLLNNALKYLDPGRPGKIHITGRQEGDRVIYCVADNGIGIPLKHQKKVFEIFYRLNPDDTNGEGLGLAIVSKIITLHGGDIWIESEPGKGSRFFISLPATEPDKKHTNSPPGQ